MDRSNLEVKVPDRIKERDTVKKLSWVSHIAQAVDQFWKIQRHFRVSGCLPDAGGAAARSNHLLVTR